MIINIFNNSERTFVYYSHFEEVQRLRNLVFCQWIYYLPRWRLRFPFDSAQSDRFEMAMYIKKETQSSSLQPHFRKRDIGIIPRNFGEFLVHPVLFLLF